LRLAMSSAALRLAVVGVGSLGRQHARVASSLPGTVLAGVHDIDGSRAETVVGEFGGRVFSDLGEVAAEADAVVVATPTVTHRDIGGALLDAGRDVLVEKPMTATLEEAEDLVERAARNRRVLQVGHIERFNPAVEAALPLVSHPRFIETHRLGVFTPRSLDVDVILDLMIHDLQIVQTVVGRPIIEVRAVGVPVLTPRIDIANARLAFEGGCVANLTASRVSADKVRKFRVFVPSRYVSIDMQSQEIAAVEVQASGIGTPRITPLAIEVAREEPLRRELAAFVAACVGRTRPTVSGEDGRAALAVALAVRDAAERHLREAEGSTRS
jgi:predicted dehydrogenase